MEHALQLLCIMAHIMREHNPPAFGVDDDGLRRGRADVDAQMERAPLGVKAWLRTYTMGVLCFQKVASRQKAPSAKKTPELTCVSRPMA